MIFENLIITSVTLALFTTNGYEFERRYANYFSRNDTGRLSLLNRASNALSRPSFMNNLPIIRNPNFPSPLIDIYNSCQNTEGEFGTCSTVALCTAGGGRPTGSCLYGLVCCIKALSQCSAVATLNNTYWQSVNNLPSSTTSCDLTIVLDQNIPEQKKMRICQVRLDFLLFTISQPNGETVCDTDSFRVTGGLNDVPAICGDNDNQHMYIHIPDSGGKRTELQLDFNFRPIQNTAPRRWRIRASYLPCGANYLAPDDCLQYVTGAAGRVWTFNWIDAPLTATRQLANQNYKVCFRRERLAPNNRLANTMCFRECPTSNGGRSFVLTADGDPASPNPNTQSQSGAPNFCKYDYLVILGGYSDGAADFRDRFCGGRLSTQNNAAASQTICTTAKPFRILYHTNNCETCVEQEVSQRDVNGQNVGFCLVYLQSE